MVLVTGANGMVGSALVKQLLDAGIAVKGLVYHGEHLLLSYHPDLEIIEGDINNVAWNAVLDGVDSVVHLAAKVHVFNKSEQVWEEFYKTNVEATKRLCEAAADANIKKFIFISTVGIYGDYPQVDQTNELVITPQTMYARSKLMAEAEVINVLKDRVPYIIFRPVMMYGPGDRGNMEKMINAIRCKRFIIPGSGNNKKSSLYVEDFAQVLLRSILDDKLRNESFIVSNKDVLSLREMCDTISLQVAGGWHVPCIPEGMIRLVGRIGDFIPFLPIDSATVKKLTIDSDYSTYSTIHDRLGIDQETTFVEALEKMGY